MPDLVELHLFAGNLAKLGVAPPAEFTRAYDLLRVGVDTALANPVAALVDDFQPASSPPRSFPIDYAPPH